jgi:hypothetical protein
MTSRARRRGSALIIVTTLLLALLVLALVVTQAALGRSRLGAEERGALGALWAAEAGVGLKLHDLRATDGAAMDEVTYDLADGAHVTVSVETVGEYLQITSRAVVDPGTPRETRRAVEVHVRSSFHPLFYKATYVGNALGIPGYGVTFGPSLATTEGGATFDESAWYGRNTRMSEEDHQVDFDGDGDLDDAPTLRMIYDNRVAWGWQGFIQSSGNNRRLDINRDGDVRDAVTAPTVTSEPTPRDPTRESPPPAPDDDWATTPRTDDADYTVGDVYVNGDVAINGGTNMFGDVDATGAVTGDPVTGTATNGTRPIAPPDLAEMDYGSLADEVVQEGSPLPGYVRGEQAPSYYGADLGPAETHDRPHFHLQNGGSSTLSFGEARDGQLILIKGNLWIHDVNDFTIDMPPGSDVRVTIVVEGNLYIADDLQYGNDDNGLLFIVKGADDAPESFVDANRNYEYDSGERLMNDDGDGVYEGPREGQGNVYFGDPRFGTGGVTDGFIYAQNNVYLVNPPMNQSPPSGQDTIFGVYGFLSAGGILDLGPRAAGSSYENFRVQYDARLQNGEISFKGMPRALGGGFEGLTVVAWREVSAE